MESLLPKQNRILKAFIFIDEKVYKRIYLINSYDYKCIYMIIGHTADILNFVAVKIPGIVNATSQ